MRTFNKRLALCLLIAAGGCVAGAYSAFAAFSNGTLISKGAAGTMFGLAFAAVVIVSWIMLPWADKRAEEGSYRDAWLWRASWIVAVCFVLANSILYCVHHRAEMTEAKGLQIEAYERAQRVEALATAELNELRKNFRWDATSGCSNVTAAKSKAYCEQVQNAQSRLQGVETILTQGRPAAKDAGAETLAWVIGADEEKIRRSLPIFWALILELVASLCMREAFATLKQPGGARQTYYDGAVAPSMMAPFNGAAARADFSPLGVVAPFTFGKRVLFEAHAMNDNMPLAAYA